MVNQRLLTIEPKSISTPGAKEEREKIKKCSEEARHDKTVVGKRVGVDAPPYGYRQAGFGRDSRLEILPDEAEIVKRIFAMYVRGSTLHDIDKALTAEDSVPQRHGRDHHEATLTKITPEE